MGGTGKGDGPGARAARGRGPEPRRAAAPRLRLYLTSPLRQRDASKERGSHRGGAEEDSEEGRRRWRRHWSAPLGDRPTRGARTSLRTTFLPTSGHPSSTCPRAGSGPRPRRWSARIVGPSGQCQRIPGGAEQGRSGEQERRGRGSGARGAFWVIPLSSAFAAEAAGGPAALRLVSVAWPRPSCGLGWRVEWAE